MSHYLTTSFLDAKAARALVYRSLCALSIFLCSESQAARINDTGITLCRNFTTWQDEPCDVEKHGRQDGVVGRDVAATTAGSGLATSTGVGFSYTKVNNLGFAVPNETALGAAGFDWVCTQDNVTGLLWEVKVNNPNHLRHYQHVYSMYSLATAAQYPMSGCIPNGGTCTATGRCDTEKYVQDVNASGMCGAGNWRLATAAELGTLARYSLDGVADNSAFFPNSISSWSSTRVRGRPLDWHYVNPDGAESTTNCYITPNIPQAIPVRLVRLAQ